MCIIGVVCCPLQHTNYRWVIVSNRDESPERAASTSDVRLQPTNPPVFCGIDAQSGGTWMAFNASNGNFAALTDVDLRHTTPAGAIRHASRARFVLSEAKKEGKMRPQLPHDVQAYARYRPSNFLMGNLWSSCEEESFLLIGSSACAEQPIKVEKHRAYVVSNGGLDDTPPWPKVCTLQRGMETALHEREGGEDGLVKRLQKLLCDDSEQKHNFTPADFADGVYESQAQLDACQRIFVTHPTWKTLSQTILLVQHDGCSTAWTRRAHGAWDKHLLKERTVI